ncbi:hypothetical protein, partial [Streptomyces sp. NPDC058954]|uniref:hypothetical protein n=1 Tax=Streptomyces sp. NPDC058954 TaxID=3346677 RepID=UPI00368766EB
MDDESVHPGRVSGDSRISALRVNGAVGIGEIDLEGPWGSGTAVAVSGFGVCGCGVGCGGFLGGVRRLLENRSPGIFFGVGSYGRASRAA